LPTTQILLIVVLLALLGWQAKLRWRSGGALEEIAVALAAGAPLVDVRTAGEFGHGHIAGAINVPVSRIGSPPKKLLKAKAGPVVVYCHSGSRSAAAAHKLRAAGFKQVLDLGPMSNHKRLPALAPKQSAAK
jgi:rhodanese-related sulfurtransferase